MRSLRRWQGPDGEKIYLPASFGPVQTDIQSSQGSQSQSRPGSLHESPRRNLPCSQRERLTPGAPVPDPHGWSVPGQSQTPLVPGVSPPPMGGVLPKGQRFRGNYNAFGRPWGAPYRASYNSVEDQLRDRLLTPQLSAPFFADVFSDTGLPLKFQSQPQIQSDLGITAITPKPPRSMPFILLSRDIKDLYDTVHTAGRVDRCPVAGGRLSGWG